MELHGIEKLQGAENWNVWKFAIRNMLRGTDGAYEVCTGEITKPLDSEKESAKFKAWDKADRSASHIIVRTLESKVLALLVTCESARDMWIKLHAIFEQQTKQAAHTVQAEFFSFSMNPSDSMVTHIGKFEGLVLRLQQLNVKPDDSSLMVKLLDTLPDEYESLRQAWWARPEEQQTLNNLIGLLTSDEKRREQRLEKNKELLALMATKTKISVNKHEPSSNQFGSTRKNISVKSSDKKGKFKCYACSGIGHFRKDCPNKKKNCNGSNRPYSDQAFVGEAKNVQTESDIWIVDSGATDHITFCKEWFTVFENFETPLEIHIGDKSTMAALGRGRINFEAYVNGMWLQSHMENVLYVPSARRNLFSLISALDKGLIFKSSNTVCEFVKDGDVKAHGVRFGRLFKMEIRINVPNKSACKNEKEVNVVESNSLQVWHEKLVHQNKRHVSAFLKQQGINAVDEDDFYAACTMGKQHQNSFKLRQQRSVTAGEGDDCPFIHEQEQSQRKMEVCKFYLKDCCAKKDKCLYMHSEFPCKFFHTGLKCYSGKKCRFSHGHLSKALRGVLFKHIETAPKEILGDFPCLSREGAVTMVSNRKGSSRQNNEMKNISSLFDIEVPLAVQIMAEKRGRENGREQEENWPSRRSTPIPKYDAEDDNNSWTLLPQTQKPSKKKKSKKRESDGEISPRNRNSCTSEEQDHDKGSRKQFRKKHKSSKRSSSTEEEVEERDSLVSEDEDRKRKSKGKRKCRDWDRARDDREKPEKIKDVAEEQFHTEELQVFAENAVDSGADSNDGLSIPAHLPKRQQCVALSTTEAEYISASEGAKEAIWLDRLFCEISTLKNVPVMFVDNLSAIKLTKNPVFHKRSKHIDVRFHFVRECVQSGKLDIQHVSSNEQLADILTKPLPRVQFEHLRFMLGLMYLGKN